MAVREGTDVDTTTMTRGAAPPFAWMALGLNRCRSRRQRALPSSSWQHGRAHTRGPPLAAQPPTSTAVRRLKAEPLRMACGSVSSPCMPHAVRSTCGGRCCPMRAIYPYTRRHHSAVPHSRTGGHTDAHTTPMPRGAAPPLALATAMGWWLGRSAMLLCSRCSPLAATHALRSAPVIPEASSFTAHLYQTWPQTRLPAAPPDSTGGHTPEARHSRRSPRPRRLCVG
jgi:hypothetical protein